jgi:hypothetical protein
VQSAATVVRQLKPSQHAPVLGIVHDVAEQGRVGWNALVLGQAVLRTKVHAPDGVQHAPLSGGSPQVSPESWHAVFATQAAPPSVVHWA